MKIKLFLIFNCFVFLQGCQVQKETVREVVEKSTDGPKLPTQTPQGGGDPGGGGNCVNSQDHCIPIDIFVKPVREKEAYKNIETIITNLIPIFPELAADLIHISQERSWYWVPVPLKTLPASTIGTFFGSEQFAMQSKKEIYFDTTIFDKQDLKEQSVSILHELVMGIRLMEFQTKADRCYSTAILELFKTPGSEEAYRKARNECHGLAGPIDQGTAISLSGESDYPNIRKLTAELYNREGKINEVEWRAWMQTNNFRRY